MYYDDDDYAKDGSDREMPPVRTSVGETDTGSTEGVPELQADEVGSAQPLEPGRVGTIYILETADKKLIKIGYTVRMSMRLAQHAVLIRKTGGDVRLIGFFPGTQKTEYNLHVHFADCRYKTEWYHREPALAKLATLFDKPIPAAQVVILPSNPAAVALGKRGGQNRAHNLTPEQRSESARKAGQASAAKRWGKKL